MQAIKDSNDRCQFVTRGVKCCEMLSITDNSTPVTYVHWVNITTLHFARDNIDCNLLMCV